MMNNEEKELILRELKCTVYEVNKEDGIIENTSNEDEWIEELVKIGEYLNNKNIKYKLVDNYNIQIEDFK